MDPTELCIDTGIPMGKVLGCIIADDTAGGGTYSRVGGCSATVLANAGLTRCTVGTHQIDYCLVSYSSVVTVATCDVNPPSAPYTLHIMIHEG